MGIELNMGVVTIIFTVLVISKTLDLLIEVIKRAVSVVVYDPVVLERNREIARLIVNSLLKEADRVMLLKLTRNSTVREIITSSPYNYDFLIPDKKYLEIINYIKDTNKTYIFEREVEEDSVLKEIYIRENIKYANFYFIKREDEGIIDKLLRKLKISESEKPIIFLTVSNKNKQVDIDRVSLLAKINKLRRVL